MIKNIRGSNFDEYVEWYLQRERRKGTLGSDDGSVPTTASGRLKLMQDKHSGKLRDWFERATWSIIELGSISDIERLICLESNWTKESGLTRDSDKLNYRLLRQYGFNASKYSYFDQNIGDKDELYKRRHYLDEFLVQIDPFRESNRIVLCSPNDNEIRTNPQGTYYLHDGIGRMLAYIYYIIYMNKPNFIPIEAFLAIQNE